MGLDLWLPKHGRSLALTVIVWVRGGLGMSCCAGWVAMAVWVGRWGGGFTW